jgi:LuxR family maltose regulon positive regulatory protein
VEPLNRREVVILQMMADGLRDSEITALLQLGSAVVKTSLTHICEKLGARSRRQAIAIAFRRGIIQ